MASRVAVGLDTPAGQVESGLVGTRDSLPEIGVVLNAGGPLLSGGIGPGPLEMHVRSFGTPIECQRRADQIPTILHRFGRDARKRDPDACRHRGVCDRDMEPVADVGPAFLRRRQSQGEPFIALREEVVGHRADCDLDRALQPASGRDLEAGFRQRVVHRLHAVLDRGDSDRQWSCQPADTVPDADVACLAFGDAHRVVNERDPYRRLDGDGDAAIDLVHDRGYDRPRLGRWL